MMSPVQRAVSLTAVLGAVGLAGCAPQAPRDLAANSQCFLARDVSGFTAVDDETVNVRVGGDTYRLELLGRCPDVDWANRIAIESRGSSWICSSLDATLVAPSAIGPQRCPVRTITKLTADQAAALPADQRP